MMNNNQFTEVEIAEMTQFLNSKNRHVCCYKPNIVINKAKFAIPNFDHNEDKLPAFAVTCHHCGQTNLYSVDVFSKA
ncbi:Uncharacterised protein [Staphylococcus simiae]|nr:Uncharacterised protein [Staphylococcus simiae]